MIANIFDSIRFDKKLFLKINKFVFFFCYKVYILLMLYHVYFHSKLNFLKFFGKIVANFKMI